MFAEQRVAMAIAGLPYTTACSPLMITFPGADAVIVSLDITMVYFRVVTISSIYPRLVGLQKKITVNAV